MFLFSITASLFSYSHSLRPFASPIRFAHSMSFEPDSVVDLQKLRADVDSATEKLVSMRDFDTSPSFFGEVPKKREIKLKDIAKHLFAAVNTKKVFSTASMTYNRHIRVWIFCYKLGSILCSSPPEAG